MMKKLTIALAACLFLLSAPVFPANAEVIYSLTGVVGDSNWQLADSHYNQPYGSLEMFANLDSVFQANGGPGGLITIDFSGPAVLLDLDQIYYGVNSLTVLCTDMSGCVDGNGYYYFPFQGGGGEDCCVSPYPIDSSLHVQDLDIPPFAPYQASFTGYTEGYDGYLFNRIVGADVVGQPFSLTVSTIPEPFTLSLFGAGLAGAVALRRRKRLSNSSLRPRMLRA
ncbi:MAG TPA: PEP-CTERM sorting domain-containing protein [Rhizomicrobium sp.]|jgi:hypothetical protein